MTSDTKILLFAAILIVFGAVLFFVAFIIHEILKNKRAKAESVARVAQSDQEKQPSMPKEVEGGAYSYGSIIMDEVLEEKIIEGLKESLRMTETMYKNLSEQFKDDRDRRIELANDWLNYLEALDNIKQARIDYRMNASDGESARIEKESARIKLEIEDKFKNLLQAAVPQAGR
jgi:hypothetical protein